MTNKLVIADDVKSILIIRMSAIGDIVMSTLMVNALRARYKTAEITWLVQSGMEDVINRHPLVSETLVWPRNKWRKLWQRFHWIKLLIEVINFIRKLRSKRFDVVIDAQGLLKSGVWARITGAPNRIGLGSREGSRLMMTQVLARPKSGGIIGAEYRYLIKELGISENHCRMELGLDADDQQFAETFVRDNQLESGYLAICPFTTRPQKHWINNNWADLINIFAASRALPSVMLGGPGDTQAASALVANTATPLFNMVGKTNVRQAAALIKEATLLVGVDTGLTHMGTAFKIPTIALFGSTCPYLQTDSSNTVVLYKKLDCSPCRRHPTCGGDFTCMKLITADDVNKVADSLLAVTK